MNHPNKVMHLIAQAQRANLTPSTGTPPHSNDSLTLTANEREEIARGVANAVNRAVEEVLPDNLKAEVTKKRQAVADKYGQVIANALAGNALDAMYENITGGKGAGAEAVANSGQYQAPDLADYFAGNKWAETDLAPDPATYPGFIK